MKTWLMALAATLLTAPGALVAQDASAQQVDPYERLYDALQSGVDDAVALERGLQQIREQLAPLPQFVELERLRPGALDEIIVLMRPIMREQSDRVEMEYRPRMIEVLRSGLSFDEATDVAEFYASPIGRKVLVTSAANVQSDRVVNAAISEQTVTTADVQADLEATAEAVLGSLTEAERNQVYREIVARPGLAKLNPLLPRIAAVRAEMEGEPFSEDEQARFNAALEAAFAPRD